MEGIGPSWREAGGSVVHPAQASLYPDPRDYYSPDWLPPRAEDQSKRPTRPSLSAPLRLRTNSVADQHPGNAALVADQIGLPQISTEFLTAPLSKQSSHESTSSSTKAERLPSFRQLSKIAAAGEEETERPATYPAPPPSLPTGLSSQSPPLAALSQPHLQQQASPRNSLSNIRQTSPISMQSESRDPYYTTHSPPSATYSSQNYYPRRRSYPHPSAPSFPASLPSGSSSDSRTQSSGTEGYSTTQTTPIEAFAQDGQIKSMMPVLDHVQQQQQQQQQPQPHGSPSLQGTFICEFPGCAAAPFQTQYLLNSHANVHSSSRPHYCPVQGCARSEGGKGFKRKNEMIRHGLVHGSPGYMCPFCPDREHKYPRPDNLQRHVRVHHIDKDRDDPALREVLAQRAEGGNRGRRRRTGP